jgi:thymidylate kinase
MTKLLRISDITLEGPDLSGKTTLYSKIHKATGFKWNIQDRAEISMAIYSEMYDRSDTHVWWERVHKKLANLNHRYIILLPSEDLLLERYASRGDEIQNEESLLDLSKRFREAASELRKYPTCIVVNITKENQFSVSARALGYLRKAEDMSTSEICMEALSAASASVNQEVTGLSFTLDVTNFKDFKYHVLKYEKEKRYYERITDSYLETISNELAGKNEYNHPENSEKSRRFVYTDPSCISYINTQVREASMTMSVVCRSTDVRDTFFYDLSFLQILSSKIKKILLKTCEISRVIINVRLDSAHIPKEKY